MKVSKMRWDTRRGDIAVWWAPEMTCTERLYQILTSLMKIRLLTQRLDDNREPIDGKESKEVDVLHNMVLHQWLQWIQADIG